MNWNVLSHWQITLKRVLPVVTFTLMKAASAVANVPTVTAARSGGDYGIDDV